MSDEKANLVEESVRPVELKKDMMDGGFAVVDRERLIEEETRVITPWYKHFINMFFAPKKMMEECFHSEPPKGASVGLVGCLAFGALLGFITMLNPVMKDTLRASGIDEGMLAQKYEMLRVTTTISTALATLLSAFGTAIVFMIIKSIMRSKGSFKNIFTMCLCANAVSAAIGCIDAVFQMLVGAQTAVLGLGAVIDMTSASVGIKVAVTLINLANIFAVIWMIIGYKVACRVSMVKSVIAVLIMEILYGGYLFATLSFSQQMMQNLGAM